MLHGGQVQATVDIPLPAPFSTHFPSKTAVPEHCLPAQALQRLQTIECFAFSLVWGIFWQGLRAWPLLQPRTAQEALQQHMRADSVASMRVRVQQSKQQQQQHYEARGPGTDAEAFGCIDAAGAFAMTVDSCSLRLSLMLQPP